MSGREWGAVAALAAVLAITASWWALALWPLPPQSPEWLARTRYVCFGSAESGLPDASGWLLLALQPPLLVGAVFVTWGRAVTDGLGRVLARPVGRVGVACAALGLATGLTVTTVRVVRAMGEPAFATTPDEPLPRTYPRLDRPAPDLQLVNQHGDIVTLATFEGRPLLITFAYAHCATICPLVVRDVLEARRRLGPGTPVGAAIMTLDPWRDVPRRLPAMARQWSAPNDVHVLSGDVETVLAVLASWGVPWRRDERTGDITHPRLTYVVDGEGKIAYATTGGVQQMVELVGRL